MSAAEKLKALDKEAVPAPWLAKDDGVTAEPVVENVAGNREDRAVIAALRNALPKIVAVVEAAESEYENSQLVNDEVIMLGRALAALDEELT